MPHIGEKADYLETSGPIVDVTPVASPFVYTAGKTGTVFITNGTISLVEYGRGGAYTGIGILTGAVALKAGDQIRITYLVAPTLKFLPG